MNKVTHFEIVAIDIERANEVASIDSILEKVTKEGGEVMMPKTHMESLGYLPACMDTEGNMFNVIQVG